MVLSWTWCCRIRKVLLWMCYCEVVAVGLTVPAFVVCGMVVRLVVDEPVMVTRELNNDSMRGSPMDFVLIISYQGLGSVRQSGNSEIQGLYCLVMNYRRLSR
nr:seipin-2-like [Tanacetum cinerariifolium]